MNQLIIAPINEISRVLKVGGQLCFNSTYEPNSELPVYRLKVNELIKIFYKYNFDIIYHTSENKAPNVSHIWCLKKKDNNNESLDPIDIKILS